MANISAWPLWGLMALVLYDVSDPDHILAEGDCVGGVVAGEGVSRDACLRERVAVFWK